jgi:multimeric flavodoxin WrbA
MSESFHPTILGLVGSSRRLGNTEVLVTEVARAAVREDSGGVRLLRLSDLDLVPCTGCMACAFRDGGACPLDDDMEFLLAEMEAADALILGAPTYSLLPPAPVKAWADRFLMAFGRRKAHTPKPAVVVGVAGLEDWSRQLLPILNSVVMAYGYRLVDSLIAYAPSPAEVLLDPGNVVRAAAAGSKLGRALTGEQLRPSFGAGRCPVCGSDFFRFTADGLECPVCAARGELVAGVPTFPPFPAHRWEPAALSRHFHDWIRATGPAYLKQRPAIKPLQRAYRAYRSWWITPPRPTKHAPD